MKKIRIGVMFGGRSSEHEVSIVSARSVISALDKSKYEAVPIYINKKGQWFLGFDEKLIQGKGIERVYLPPDPTKKDLVSVDRGSIKQKNIDVVFSLLHGTFGEDGSIQGLLELSGVPYVGAGVAASAIGMDKDLMKKILKSADLPITKYLVFLRKQTKDQANKTVSEVERELKYPVFVKPANLGSSVGITKAHDSKELLVGIELAYRYDRKILIEQGINNAREIEVAILGNDNPEVSVCGEVVPSKEFYDYEDKYILDKAKLIIPAFISSKLSKKIRNMAAVAFKSIDCSGIARVDFLLKPKKEEVYITEVNTIPGFTPISMYPKLWEKSGFPYTELIDRLIELAIERYNDKKQNKTSFSSKLLM